MFHVKQVESLNNLISFLDSELIVLSSQQRKSLYFYYHALLQYAGKHNLISKNDINFIIEKHFLSSFCFVNAIRKNINEKDQILDLGSGAGFPGIILAIFFSGNRVTMIDSVRKKSVFLKRVIEEIGIEAIVINDRIENYIQNNDCIYKIITARALASIDDLVEYIRPILKKSTLHTIKGNDFYVEMNSCKNEIKVSSIDFEENWLNQSPYLKNKVYLKINSI